MSRTTLFLVVAIIGLFASGSAQSALRGAAASKKARAMNPFPMPKVLPGAGLVKGKVELLPPGPAPEPGLPSAVTIAVEGREVVVTVASIDVNCCTKRIEPSVEVRDGVVEIRLWEYMTDVCECFTRRSARLSLAPFDPKDLEFRVYSNNRALPCGTGRAWRPPTGPI